MARVTSERAGLQRVVAEDQAIPQEDRQLQVVRRPDGSAVVGPEGLPFYNESGLMETREIRDQQRFDSVLDTIGSGGVKVKDVMDRLGITSVSQLGNIALDQLDIHINALQRGQTAASAAAGAGQGAADLLRDVTRGQFAGLRSELQSDIEFDQARALKEFDRNERDINESFSDRINAITGRVGEAQSDLASDNKSYRMFMDTIAPGFAEAVDKAEKAAAATAAIDQTFDESQEGIDQAYASRSGRVRAIADKVAGSNAQVAQQLTDSIFEMKGFIDEQNTLDRSQTLFLHKAAAGLAAAAAESELAGKTGEAARERFVNQRKYERIIQGLIRQRQQLNVDKLRAERDLREAREDWKLGFDHNNSKAIAKLDREEFAAISANVDFDDWQDVVFFNTIKSFSTNPENEIPRTAWESVQSVSDSMVANEIVDFETWSQLIATQGPEVSGFDPVAIMEMAVWQDQIEILAAASIEGVDFFNEQHSGVPTSDFGVLQQNLDQNINWLGLPPSIAEELALGQLNR